MSRIILGVWAVLLAGCGGGQPATITVPTPTMPEDRGPIDYVKWPTLTKEPVRVSPEQFARCEPGLNGAVRGPHFVFTVKYFVKPETEAAMRAGTAPMPVGSVIVKEKWHRDFATVPDAYAAMVKREPGYDPDHGDWEYLYAVAHDRIDRGKLPSCINCHRLAKDSDYLFRTYLGQ